MPYVREEFKLELKNRFSVLSTQNEDTKSEESWKAIKMKAYRCHLFREINDIDKLSLSI